MKVRLDLRVFCSNMETMFKETCRLDRRGLRKSNSVSFDSYGNKKIAGRLIEVFKMFDEMDNLDMNNFDELIHEDFLFHSDLLTLEKAYMRISYHVTELLVLE